MANGLDVKIATFPLQDTANGWQGNAVTGHVLRAPTNAFGGGVRILEAWASNAAATGAGTGFSLQLENWGTAGTAIKAASGTIAAAIGGTASPWAANTPKNFTLSAPLVDAGEYIVLRKTETNSSDPTRGVVSIAYVMGN
jgi:hypothetical protein